MTPGATARSPSFIATHTDNSSAIKLEKRPRLRGSVVLPGSKSIANRALLLSALASGKTRITNLPDADDVRVMIKTLPLLGVWLREAGPGVYDVTGTGGPFPISSAVLELENAGTALRPLVAALAASKGRFIVDGNEQMRRRPIRDLVSGLAALGVKIDAPTGCPPVTIETTGLSGGRTTLSGKVSSQFISALLLAAPLAQNSDITLIAEGEIVSRPYIDLTLRMMEVFGIRVEHSNYREYTIPHGRAYHSPGSYAIEGDATAATYFLGAGALPGSGPVTVHGLGIHSMQGDVHFADVLEAMGAVLDRGETSITATGPVTGRLRPIDIDMNAMPDAAMTLAVLALFADGTTHIRNIANLRVKESERIAGLRRELEKLGASVHEDTDALHITPPTNIKAARIATYKDHRMAMAFALASAGTEVTIEDPACTSKTYRNFFDDFLRLDRQA